MKHFSIQMRFVQKYLSILYFTKKWKLFQRVYKIHSQLKSKEKSCKLAHWSSSASLDFEKNGNFHLKKYLTITLDNPPFNENDKSSHKSHFDTSVIFLLNFWNLNRHIDHFEFIETCLNILISRNVFFYFFKFSALYVCKLAHS